MNRHVQPSTPQIVTTPEEIAVGYNVDHERLLRAGVSEWNSWREANGGEWPLLRGANLRGLSLVGYDLHFASLQHADLTGCDLSDAWLSSAHFEQANLTDAKLFGAFAEWASFTAAKMDKCFAMEANFTKANLQQVSAIGAHFASAIFHNASMPAVVLRESYLHQTDFTDAWLEQADFRGATLAQTKFIDSDLTEAQGLDACTHSSYSYLDFRTLERCRRHLPRIFLEGCGLSATIIDFLPGLHNDGIQFYSCFLSHSHMDKHFVQVLYTEFQKRGIRCWLDDHQLLPGDDIFEQVQRGIKLWDKIILVCSKNSLHSWWVDNELNVTFAKEQELMRSRGKKILVLVPLNLDNHLFSPEWTSGKATEVRSRLAADFVGWEQDQARFTAELDRLVNALRSDSGGRESPPESRL